MIIKIVPTNSTSPFPCQGLVVYWLGRGARLDVEPQEARPEQAAQHRGHDDGADADAARRELLLL